MPACTAFQLACVFIFIAMGTMTTSCLKWSNRIYAEGSDGKVRKFHHPCLQVSFMFLGELYCLIIYYILYCFFKIKKNGREETNFITKGNRKFNPLILVPAAAFDLAANTINFIGLTMTYASSFQMFRGSIIIFIGIFSYIFLGRRLKVSELMGMAMVLVGLSIVGMTDFFFSNKDEEYSPLEILTGDLLIVFAQIFGAGYMVYEQKFCNKYEIPAMQAAGLQGVFGLIITGILNTIYYFINVGDKFGGKNNPRHVMEDAIDGFIQIYNQPRLVLIFFLHTTATCVYKFTGISISKQLSALTRKVVDSFRIITIWGIGLIWFDQEFVWSTINGFFVLFYGLLLYSGCSVFGDKMKQHSIYVPGLED